MNQKQITIELRKILDRADVGSDMLTNRKMSPKHISEIEILLENLSLLVLDLKFDAEVSKRELFEVRKILEDST